MTMTTMTTTTTTTTATTHILLTGGRVVNADQEFMADVLITNDKIADVGNPHLLKVPTENVQVVDCAGKLIIPGGIDPHTQ